MDEPKRSTALVASTTEVKLEAVRLALGKKYDMLLKGLEVRARGQARGGGLEGADTVSGADAPSRVAEQPYGSAETRRGMQNRLQALARDAKASGVDFLVSIENGLVRYGDDGEALPADAPDVPGSAWFDFAWVGVQHVQSKRAAYACSAAVCFPPGDCINARKRGFATTTVGEVLHQRKVPDARHDPHTGLTGGLMGRKEILADAVCVALGTLVAQLRATANQQLRAEAEKAKK